MALECIRLVVNYLPRALAAPRSREAREALGLATDLGGYSIMLGGTNGAHLTSSRSWTSSATAGPVGC